MPHPDAVQTASSLFSLREPVPSSWQKTLNGARSLLTSDTGKISWQTFRHKTTVNHEGDRPCKHSKRRLPLRKLAPARCACAAPDATLLASNDARFAPWCGIEICAPSLRSIASRGRRWPNAAATLVSKPEPDVPRFRVG